jgi:O-glycosyl hydrolase
MALKRLFVNFFLVALTSTATIGCVHSQANVLARKRSTVVISINPDQKYQVIRSFGASDAWSCNFVGNWPDAKRDQVAAWLFSKDLDRNGQPRGIGLSLWRFNVGAGSADQNNIGDPWRRAEGFLQSDGTFDWKKQSGQQWFLRTAKAHHVEQLLAFSNSPPVQFTKNGMAYSGGGDAANISADKYRDFAKFLVTVLEHFKSEQIPFDYVSPFNEPQWDWADNKQEGSPYKNSEIFSITKKLDSLLTAAGLSTKIQISEAGKLNYLYELADRRTRGDQINEFFNDASATYLGTMTHVDAVISGHSYFTAHPVSTLEAVRRNLKNRMAVASIPLEFWQSEYCILGDGEEVKPRGKDLGIDPALYIARIIHFDLTVANASSWSWWLAVSPYNVKDGLVYVDKNLNDGNVQDSKMLWALGNFSRFIRPGSYRIDVSSKEVDVNNAYGLMVSSYVNTDGQVVIVAINYGANDATVDLRISGRKSGSVTVYLTDAVGGNDLKPKKIRDLSNVVLPARSISTLVTK